MDEQIKKFINDYLDSMPSRSRVTMRDLSVYVHSKIGFNQKAAYEIVREIVLSRKDFLTFRGIGACKQ